MEKTEARRLKQLLTTQAVTAGLLGLLALAFGATAALAATIGAGTSLFGNVIAALWAFRDYRAQEPERILLRFYSAEVVKISVVVLIFAAALAAVDGLNIAVLLGAYLVVQVVSPVVAAQLDTRPSCRPGVGKQK